VGRPPWWRYYEPPRWFPDWLHMLVCTHCRATMRYLRELDRPHHATVYTQARKRIGRCAAGLGWPLGPVRRSRG
jgi:hypothetical protein